MDKRGWCHLPLPLPDLSRVSCSCSTNIQWRISSGRSVNLKRSAAIGLCCSLQERVITSMRRQAATRGSNYRCTFTLRPSVKCAIMQVALVQATLHALHAAPPWQPACSSPLLACLGPPSLAEVRLAHKALSWFIYVGVESCYPGARRTAPPARFLWG